MPTTPATTANTLERNWALLHAAEPETCDLRISKPVEASCRDPDRCGIGNSEGLLRACSVKQPAVRVPLQHVASADTDAPPATICLHKKREVRPDEFCSSLGPCGCDLL